VIDEARARGCTAVLVIDDDTGRSYHVQLQTLATLGRRLNYGSGDQIALALRHWRQEPADNPQPAPVSRETPPQHEPNPQMALFGEVTR
jgi:hypothetical protein